MNRINYSADGAMIVSEPGCNWLARLYAQAIAWMQKQAEGRRTLQHARTLDDRMLEDVGLTRADLRREGYFDLFGR